MRTEIVDTSAFTEEYANKSDDELLCLIAERNTLLPQAVTALDREVQRRGLKRQNAARVKKRIDTLKARYEHGFLVHKLGAAENERGLKKFHGEEEPEYHRRYRSFDRVDILNAIDAERFKFKIWKTFRERTGHWPVLSISFHYLKALLLIGGMILAIVWMVHHDPGKSGWATFVMIAVFVLYYLLLDMVSRLMRRIDWKLFGQKSTDGK